MPGAVSLIHSFRASKKKKLLILDLNGVLEDITNVKKTSIKAVGHIQGKSGK